MAGAMGGALLSAVTPLVVQAARNYSIRYGPQYTNKGIARTDEFAQEAFRARAFVREKALEDYEPLIEAEYREIIMNSDKDMDPEMDLIDLSDSRAQEVMYSASGRIAADVSANLRLEKQEPKTIRLFCQTIRMSRESIGTEAFCSPFPFLAHWGVEAGILLLRSLSIIG